MRRVGIVMGSDSDMPIAEKAIDRLEKYGIPYEVHIYSAHRTPEQARKFASEAEKNGFGAIIALAGKAAHLAGAIAANTTLPVIGVPCQGANFAGLDALQESQIEAWAVNSDIRQSTAFETSNPLLNKIDKIMPPPKMSMP